MEAGSLLQSFAIAKDGRIVSVDEVERGQACGCTCPCCKRPLIARQGDVRGWHFAHATGADCDGGAESALEPIAKPIQGDAARLQQIFWNLLTNAVKFTPEGGRVRVALARVRSNVEVTVSDTGQGLHPDFLPHLFERFRQADVSSTREHGGLGIGLALVKELTELHGGEVF